MATTKDRLNKYFAMIDRRVLTKVSQFIQWLRKPSFFAVRLVVALLLIVGGFFSFLPILGLWMPVVHCARCALVAKTLSQSVDVG
jgi:hypothetical protein